MKIYEISYWAYDENNRNLDERGRINFYATKELALKAFEEINPTDFMRDIYSHWCGEDQLDGIPELESKSQLTQGLLSMEYVFKERTIKCFLQSSILTSYYAYKTKAHLSIYIKEHDLIDN